MAYGTCCWSLRELARPESFTPAPDDLGRDAVSRGDARRLLDERRAEELRVRALRAVQEREAVEADQRLRTSWGVGVPASMIPAGMSFLRLRCRLSWMLLVICRAGRRWQRIYCPMAA
jgi:hypothetical protein